MPSGPRGQRQARYISWVRAAKYTVRLGDIDELMDKMFAIARLILRAFGLIRREAIQYLAAENEVAAWKAV
jgi:hypothetical protein